MLKTRVITAVILLLVLFGVLSSGMVAAWNGFVLVILFAAFWEWGKLGSFSMNQSLIFASTAIFVFSSTLFLFDFSHLAFPFMAMAGIFWVAFAPWCLRKVSIGKLENTIFYLPIGIVLICAAGLALCLAYRVGLVFLLSIVSICWVADIFAYIFGRLLGRNKLAPRVSPGKSWEGAVGGTFSVVILSWLLVYFSTRFPVLEQSWQFMAFTKWHPLVFTFWLVVLSAYSIVGDLFESLLKRRSGLKDSSQLLPGHGGVLDRIDAQLPVLPLAILLLGSTGV